MRVYTAKRILSLYDELYAGPFRVEFRDAISCPVSEKCNHPERLSVRNFKVTKDPSSQWKYKYNMDVNLSIPFDDAFKGDVHVSRWNAQSSSWINNVFKTAVNNPCSTLKSHRPDLFKQVSDLYYGGKVTDCPLPPVTAAIRNFAMESKPAGNIKALPYGRFKSRMKILDSSQTCINCYDIVVDILPKRRS